MEKHAKAITVSFCKSSKDTCNNKIKSVGPLSLSMISSKRTWGAINGFIEGSQRGNREHVGQLPLSMVSSMGAGGTINGFIERRQGGREQGTPHTQRDMRGISPVICGREGAASIYFFPNLSQSDWERNSLIQGFVLCLILS